MPVPAELEGKQLVGSIWIRRMGKHRGFRWTIVNVSEAGVRLEPGAGQRGWRTHIGDKRVQSIQWPMFMNLYEPEGKLSMKVTIDKEGYIQKVEKEGTVVNNGIVEAKQVVKTVPMRVCNGAWHFGKLVPEDQFQIAVRGPNKGKLGVTCNSCREKARESDRRNRALKGRVKIQPKYEFIPSPTKKPEPVISLATERELTETEQLTVKEAFNAAVRQPATRQKKRWKVTIIKETEVIVEADDYLDAGIAAGNGEVIRVERL